MSRELKAYCVAWVHNMTGARGKGQPLKYHVCLTWVGAMNKKYPDMEHWVEHV